MWCPTCQQDVPALVSGDADIGRCPRCRCPLSFPRPDSASSDHTTPLDCGVELDSAPASHRPPVDLNDRDVTERLKRIERLLTRQLTTGPSTRRDSPLGVGLPPQLGAGNPIQLGAGLPARPTVHRIDIPHRINTTMVRRKGATATSGWRSSGSSAAGLWAALIFALAGSIAWLIGTAASASMPIVAALAGAGLTIPLQTAGICLFLAGTFSAVIQGIVSSRRVAHRLGSLETAANDLLATTNRTHMSGSTAFYADLARGASPHLLLADIKGQLDQLAVQMAEKRGR